MGIFGITKSSNNNINNKKLSGRNLKLLNHVQEIKIVV